MRNSIQAAVQTAIAEGYLPEACAHMSDIEIVELLLHAAREYDDVIGHFLVMRTEQWSAAHTTEGTPSENRRPRSDSGKDDA